MSGEGLEKYPDYPAADPAEESEHATGPLEVPTEQEPGVGEAGQEQHE
jgi:hypothetical protein